MLLFYLAWFFRNILYNIIYKIYDNLSKPVWQVKIILNFCYDNITILLSFG